MSGLVHEIPRRAERRPSRLVVIFTSPRRPVTLPPRPENIRLHPRDLIQQHRPLDRIEHPQRDLPAAQNQKHRREPEHEPNIVQYNRQDEDGDEQEHLLYGTENFDVSNHKTLLVAVTKRHRLNTFLLINLYTNTSVYK